jgi:hypothetical protein
MHSRGTRTERELKILCYKPNQQNKFRNVNEPSNSECYTPSSEPFSTWLVLV